MSKATPPNQHTNWASLTEDSAQPWKTLSSSVLIGGFRVVLEDRVLVKPGIETLYQYRPRGPRAAFVFPVTAEGEAVLIKQYRYPLRATITEVVAGGVEGDEDLQYAASRELLEEVGGKASEWVPLPGFYPQPSISGVIFYGFLALGVNIGETQHEATETIERLVVPLAEAYQWLEEGKIQDGPSGLVMWHAKKHLIQRGLLKE